MFSRHATLAAVLGVMFVFSASSASAQRTPLNTGRNIFSTQQDVELGRHLAQDAERNLQVSNNSYAHGYISALGNQLADNAPGYHFPFEFTIFIDPAINSFALPGGFIYVSSGLVQMAQSEAQLAGALAHQIAHVVLRHGSQRVSRDYTDARFSGTPTVQDAINRLGIDVNSDSPVLRYSVEQEREADVIASQIMFDTQFDPREMTQFFSRVAGQAQQLRSEFLSSHPAPGNRQAVVRQELRKLGNLPASLRVNSPDLRTTQNHLRNEVANPGGFVLNDSGAFGRGRPSANRPALPSTRFVTYEAPDMDFRHPDNWYVTTTEGYDITVAPDGGVLGDQLAWGMKIGSYRTRGEGYFGQNSFVIPGAQRSGAMTLATATDQLLNELRTANPNMKEVRARARRTVNGEAALVLELSNDSPIGGRELSRLVTVMRPNGLLYYFVGVAPEADFNRYSSTFDMIVSSVVFY